MMTVEIRDILRGLTAEDGLNIPLGTLAIYCGVPNQTMSDYVNGKCNPSKKRQEQIMKGLNEYMNEYKEIMNGKVDWLYNKRIQ